MNENGSPKIIKNVVKNDEKGGPKLMQNVVKNEWKWKINAKCTLEIMQNVV